MPADDAIDLRQTTGVMAVVVFFFLNAPLAADVLTDTDLRLLMSEEQIRTHMEYVQIYIDSAEREDPNGWNSLKEMALKMQEIKNVSPPMDMATRLEMIVVRSKSRVDAAGQLRAYLNSIQDQLNRIEALKQKTSFNPDDENAMNPYMGGEWSILNTASEKTADEVLLPKDWPRAVRIILYRHITNVPKQESAAYERLKKAVDSRDPDVILRVVESKFQSGSDIQWWGCRIILQHLPKEYADAVVRLILKDDPKDLFNPGFRGHVMHSSILENQADTILGYLAPSIMGQSDVWSWNVWMKLCRSAHRPRIDLLIERIQSLDYAKTATDILPVLREAGDTYTQQIISALKESAIKLSDDPAYLSRMRAELFWWQDKIRTRSSMEQLRFSPNFLYEAKENSRQSEQVYLIGAFPNPWRNLNTAIGNRLCLYDQKQGRLYHFPMPNPVFYKRLPGAPSTYLVIACDIAVKAAAGSRRDTTPDEFRVSVLYDEDYVHALKNCMACLWVPSSEKIDSIGVMPVSPASTNYAFSPGGRKLAYVSPQEWEVGDVGNLGVITIGDKNKMTFETVSASRDHIHNVHAWVRDEKVLYSRVSNDGTIGASELWIYDLPAKSSRQLSAGLWSEKYESLHILNARPTPDFSKIEFEVEYRYPGGGKCCTQSFIYDLPTDQRRPRTQPQPIPQKPR